MPVPNGQVRSKPAFAPVRAPVSDGSSGKVRMPSTTMRSRSGWNLVASAQSICSSEKMSTSGSTDEHVLDVDQRAEAGGDRVARLAGNALAQRHAQVEHAAAGGGGMHGERLAHRGFERAPDHDLGAQRVEQRGIGARERPAADGRGLKQRVAAARDRGQVEDRVALERAVIAEELAVGAFRLDVAARRRDSLPAPTRRRRGRGCRC